MTVNEQEIEAALEELVELGLVRHKRDENGAPMFRDGHRVWEAVPLAEREAPEATQ